MHDRQTSTIRSHRLASGRWELEVEYRHPLLGVCTHYRTVNADTAAAIHTDAIHTTYGVDADGQYKVTTLHAADAAADIVALPLVLR